MTQSKSNSTPTPEKKTDTKKRAPRRAATKTASKRAPRAKKVRNPTIIVPAVPMRGMVAFPGMVLPLFIGREKSIEAIVKANETDKMVLLVSQRDEEKEEPHSKDLFQIGVLAEVAQMMKMPDGNLRVVIESQGRVKVVDWLSDDPFFVAEIEAIEEAPLVETPESEALMRRLKEGFEQVVTMSKSVPPEAMHNALTLEELGPLADLVVSFLEVPSEARQQVLEAVDPLERGRLVAGMLAHELQILEIDRELDSQVRDGVNESQREYFLRERLKAIQDKLNSSEGGGGDVEQLRAKIDECGMDGEAREKALAEIERLERMPSIAPEYSVIRTYIELMCDLPWQKRSEDDLSLQRALKILDEDHYGLEKIKDRILEFLAVRKLNPSGKGPILCFMGPPGVGKTSIGKSIARSMGREFLRLSLGGIHDEAEIRGHRRTYIGSMPGRIISGLKRVKTKNPVFLLDEIDKIGRDMRGDPSSALLEALDPEQNSTFSDHYLEVPFDLSEVLWIATGNMLDPIAPALRDRLEIITFPGYTEAEKTAIGRGFLVPKQLGENGLTAEQVTWTDAAISSAIQDYTREAGVRNLEREIGGVCRKIARKVAELDDISEWKPVEVTEEMLPKYLGPRKFIHERGAEDDEIGTAQGLAWTEVGGELLPIEVSLVEGEGKTKLTGNLGAVMKESCEAAMTYARSHATELGIDGDWTKSHDAHIHVPAGATPKDGPSAGVAIVVALVSAMTKRAVRNDVAVTGEISLRGRVLPVGGVREKVLAAHRAGIKHVLLPRENERDLEELSDEVKRDITFHPLDKLGEAIGLALRATPDKSDPVAKIAGIATDETLIEEEAERKKKVRKKKAAA